MLRDKEFDFSSKLRQGSVIERLKEYIDWQRNLRNSGSGSIPIWAPVSINMDLTSACNFACPHCVDSGIIHKSYSLDTVTIKKSIDILRKNGLLSVILIGGGEPTMHRDFEEIATYIKQKGLQLGVATNGSNLKRLMRVADIFEKGDWVRLSLDSANEDTFVASHRPPKNVTLKGILDDARVLKKANKDISLGYSFVIVWPGIHMNGQELASNIDQMAKAAYLAKKYDFDFISFKPCLVRLEDSKKEALVDDKDRQKLAQVASDIAKGLEEVRSGDHPKVLESVNLRAMLQDRVEELEKQPKTCHMQFFRTVLSPFGIYLCTAFRGVDSALIGGPDGYSDQAKLEETLHRLERSIKDFDASKECRQVACFYHHVNWWIENFIESDNDVEMLERLEDDNFFL